MPRYNSGAAVYSTGLGGITNLNVDLGTETASDDSGAIYDETRSIVRQYPIVEFDTKSIAGSINLWGIPGTCIDGTPPLLVYGNVLGDCKSPPLSTDNAKYTINAGHIKIGTLTASRGEDATLSWMVDALTDGSNEPIAPDYAGNTLPTSLSVGQWTLGAIKIGNLVLSDIASISLDFGVQMTSKTPMLGSVWPDSIAVRKVQPTLTIQVFDPRFWDAAVIPSLGLAATHVNTLIQLKKRANLTTFVPDATETHVSFTMGGIIYPTNVFSGGSNSEAVGTIVLQGVHDGTNVPVIADTTAPYDPTP